MPHNAWSPLYATELLEDRTLLTVSVVSSFVGGNSAEGTVQVTALAKVATTTVLNSSANPSTPGQSVTFTATVSGVGGTPTGKVTFMDGTFVIQTVSLSTGSATLTIKVPAPGDHSITALYKGDRSFQASTSNALVQAVGEPVVNPVSVADPTLGGGLGNSDSTSGPFAISPDGRYIAFASSATNLVNGVTSGISEVFVRDTLSGTTSLVSVDGAGNQANGPSYQAALAVASNGTVYVAFASTATNLGASSGAQQIYLKDLTTGALTLVSTDESGNEANASSSNPAVAVDPNGTVYVAFDSYASNIVNGAGNFNSDVFVKNMSSHVTKLVSEGIGGHQAQNSANPSVAIDHVGNVYVAFVSAATNLVSGNTVGVTQIYLRNVTAGITTCASTDSAGNQVYGIFGSPSVAIDGSDNIYVAFESDATTLVSGDTNGVKDVFVKNLTTQITSRVNTDRAGVQANAISGNPALAIDQLGNVYVVFWSVATNLVAGGATGVFVKSLTSGVTTRIGPMGGSNPYYPAIGADSASNVFVAFWSAENGAYQQFSAKLAINFGLDVSGRQGSINWMDVAGTGALGFAFVKATQGTALKDSQFDSNAPGAVAAGLVVGAYHYAAQRGFKTGRESLRYD